MILSNKHRYTLLRVSRLLLAPFYSFLALLLKKNNNIVITASYNMEFSDNARALFEMLICHDDYSKRVYFVINDEQKRSELNQQYPGRFISNQSFKEALFILKARYWFCSAMELPLGTFFQRHLRQVIHLGHGMLYKKVGVGESTVSWYKKLYYYLLTSSFTYTIATSEFCKKDIAESFGMPLDRVLITPQPKTALVAKPAVISNHLLSNQTLTHVLYAPTWRPYAAVELFAFPDLDLPNLFQFLQENDIHLWLRVHPRLEQDIDARLFGSPNIHWFGAKDYPEINSYLSYFDALITDYSSIFYDFITLERPVLFFDYDLTQYQQVVGLVDRYQEVKCAETTISPTQFFEQLLSIQAKSFDLARVKKANALINYPIDNENIGSEVLQKLQIN